MAPGSGWRDRRSSPSSRVRIDMPNSLDAVWRIDVKKESVQLPPAVRRRLRRIIEPLGAASKRVYTTRGRRLIEKSQIPVWSRVQNKNEIVYRINDDHPLVVDLLARLHAETRGDFLRIIEVAGASLPMDALFADLGGDMESLVSSATSEETLRYAAFTTFDHLLKTSRSRDDVLTIMRVAEPFRSNWARTAQILNAGSGEGRRMTDPISNLESMVAAALANQQGPTAEQIRELINGLRQLTMFQGITEEDAELLAKRFEERVSITQNLGCVLTERDHQPCLDAARVRIEPYYWNRYQQHLTQEGFPNSVVTTLDEVTARVLGLMQDPSRSGPWDRRGMVVGHMQSGKTANYTGLICKAADAGYKLIVVIAGVHNNLRSQTQRRIDEGFVGRDSARLLSRQDDRFVGVGRFDQTRRPVTFTNTLRDFNKMTATGVGIPLQNLTEPAVFVIKKNSSTLKNLIEWLKEHSSRGGTSSINEPILLIDDEADNASINIRHGAGEVSRINGQLRELLQIFDRSCYVGYTATPFANIFIDPETEDQMRGEDLFFRSFIVSLAPPSN